MKSLIRNKLRKHFAFAILSLLLWQTATAQSRIGIVVLHGKGGMPGGYVGELASSLERKGYIVANVEMPWSKQRDYDVGIAAADQQLDSALDKLRTAGAGKVFVAGHSQGGLFALHYGNKHDFDGLIAIAPGGSSGSRVYKEKLGDTVELARKLVAEGKGNEKTRLADYEGARGAYPIMTTPAIYLEWFEPEGAMNEWNAITNLNPKIPVLFIAPKNDYPTLQKIKQSMFDGLPKHPLTTLYEPEANHAGAPSASIAEIARWTRDVSGEK